MIIGIIFFCFLIYEIYCVIQNDHLRKEKQKEWEPYRHKPSWDKEKDQYEKDVEELEWTVKNPNFIPTDLNDISLYKNKDRDNK